MAQPIFINRSDLVRNSILDGNVDSTKFMFFISLAQTIHIQNYLGTELYEEFEGMITANTLTLVANPNHYNLMVDYIQPMLIWFAQSDYIPWASIQINSESATKEELDYLVAKAREYAEYYTRRFIDYMNFNQNLFPKYYSNSNDDIDPSQDAVFNGWVL